MRVRVRVCVRFPSYVPMRIADPPPAPPSTKQKMWSLAIGNLSFTGVIEAVFKHAPKGRGCVAIDPNNHGHVEFVGDHCYHKVFMTFALFSVASLIIAGAAVFLTKGRQKL